MTLAIFWYKNHFSIINIKEVTDVFVRPIGQQWKNSKNDKKCLFSSENSPNKMIDYNKKSLTHFQYSI